MRIFKILVLILPILIVIDVKISLTDTMNVGFKEFVFALLVFYVFRIREIIQVRKEKFILLWVLFLFVSFLNNFILNNIPNSTLTLIRITESVIFTLAVRKYLKYFPVLSIYKSVVISVFVLCIQILLSTFGIIMTDMTLGGIAGIWLSMGLLILYFKFKTFDLWNVLKVFLLVLLTVSSYFSGGTTWFMISIGLIGFDYIKKMNTLRFILSASMIAAGLIFYTQISAFVMKDEKMAQVAAAVETNNITEIGTIGSRLVRWGNITDDIKHNWLWGVGYENIDLGLPDWIETDNPDNVYLQLWLENGLMGLICILMILIFGLKIRFEKKSNDASILRNIYLLLLIGGITWGFLIGYGILIFGLIVGLSSAKGLPQFNFIQNKNE